jgi:transcriptional regulator GlxA family with amidase domain
MEWICDRYDRGAIVAALCTGTFVLAETGLLNERLATTNWLYARRFRNRFPNVHLHPERILTHDRRLICSGAFTAFYHIGLHLIEQFADRDLAALCSKIFLIDPNRTSQASYTIFNVFKQHGDDGILSAQNWLENNFARGIRIEDLARQTGISPRHFIRRFKKATGESPLSYLQHIRMETAKNLLETKSTTIDEITRAIGYENSCTFRKLFKECTGLSPREYRDKFARNPIIDGTALS